MSILFEPIEIGPYTLPNRIFMAPMSRNRASPLGVMPDFAIDYYRRRAGAGLIIAESTEVNAWSNGMNAPGIYRQDQIAAWRRITDAVHEEGGRIFVQFWHSGRAAHRSLNPPGRPVVGPSAIGIGRQIMTREGLQPATQPRALTLDEIAELRSDYAASARNALQAGFDGIEVQAANGYLIDQFLQDAANRRTDAYGGSASRRARFLMEVLQDAIAIWGPERIGVRVSPSGDFNEIGDSDPLGTFTHVFGRLNELGLGYLHMVETLPWAEATPEKTAVNDALRKLWSGVFISNGGFDADSGARHVRAGKAGAIAFGRPWIANPDLVERMRSAAPLAAADEATMYGGGPEGYSDYPALAEAQPVRQSMR